MCLNKVFAFQICQYLSISCHSHSTKSILWKNRINNANWRLDAQQRGVKQEQKFVVVIRVVEFSRKGYIIRLKMIKKTSAFFFWNFLIAFLKLLTKIMLNFWQLPTFRIQSFLLGMLIFRQNLSDVSAWGAFIKTKKSYRLLPKTCDCAKMFE